METFYAIRIALLRKTLCIVTLIDPKTPEELMQKDVFDNYMSYLELEKIRRVRDRRADRINFLLDNLTTIGMTAKTDKELVDDINEHITEDVLDRKIFGTGEDEFPDIERYLEYKEKIKRIQEEPSMEKHHDIMRQNLDVGYERREMEQMIEEFPVPYEPFEAEPASDDEEAPADRS
jgi:hypothetical protein